MSFRPLTPALAEIALKELNEVPARVEADLQHLKDWIKKQPHLHARLDDQWLVAYLRGNKYSMEKAKQKIDLFYTLRSVASHPFLADPRCPKIQEVLRLKCSILLPKSKNPTDPRCSITRLGHVDPAKFSIVDITALDCLKQNILIMEDDKAIVCGLSIIVDFHGITMAHVAQISPSLIKKWFMAVQGAYPLRLKGIHYVNIPNGFETLFNITKSLANEKIRRRLHVHNKNYEELYKFFPKEMLPAEYGGSAGKIEEIHDFLGEKFEEYIDWLVDDMQYKTDESKRIGKSQVAEEFSGAEGSFRQLQFD